MIIFSAKHVTAEILSSNYSYPRTIASAYYFMILNETIKIVNDKIL